ncbi:MAG: putative metal-binding motif-containing protein [Deltaproteobacteria bacterium]|nr:putative metal-binding motif-containing protein [Deltaproteobacteria bacterium]
MTWLALRDGAWSVFVRSPLLLALLLASGCMGPWQDEWSVGASSLVTDDDDSAGSEDPANDDDASDDDDDGVPSTETACTDGADNDQDGYFDCNDPDCFDDPACPGNGDDDDATGDDDDDDDDDDGAGDDDDATTDVDGDLDGWPSSQDCDDADPAISPGAFEVCDDYTDQDCDSLVDCDDADCDQSMFCAEDSWEPNEVAGDAWDVTTFPSTWTGVLCPDSPDWFKVCSGVGGSADITIEVYATATNPGIGTPLQVFSYQDATPAGYSSSEFAFGLEFSPPATGTTCDGYIVTMTLVNPVPCP